MFVRLRGGSDGTAGFAASDVAASRPPTPAGRHHKAKVTHKPVHHAAPKHHAPAAPKHHAPAAPKHHATAKHTVKTGAVHPTATTSLSLSLAGHRKKK